MDYMDKKKYSGRTLIFRNREYKNIQMNSIKKPISIIKGC